MPSAPRASSPSVLDVPVNASSPPLPCGAAVDGGVLPADTGGLPLPGAVVLEAAVVVVGAPLTTTVPVMLGCTLQW